MFKYEGVDGTSDGAVLAMITTWLVDAVLISVCGTDSIFLLLEKVFLTQSVSPEGLTSGFLKESSFSGSVSLFLFCAGVPS